MKNDFACVHDNKLIFGDVLHGKSAQSLYVWGSDLDVFDLISHDHWVPAVVLLVMYPLSVKTSLAESWIALFTSLKTLALVFPALIFASAFTSYFFNFAGGRALALR